jgi:hypothetical protein
VQKLMMLAAAALALLAVPSALAEPLYGPDNLPPNLGPATDPPKSGKSGPSSDMSDMPICEPGDPTCFPPPPPPPPPPGTPDYAAYGWHGEITPNGYIRGWACDPNDFNYPLQMHFYANNGRGTHVFMGSATAWDWWNEGVAGACGGNPWHGYYFYIPDWIRNGEGWQVYSYAINVCGTYCEQGNPQQFGDGAVFGFGTPPGYYDDAVGGNPASYDLLGGDGAVCGLPGTTQFTHDATPWVKRGLVFWQRKLLLKVNWCSNRARTKITGYTYHAYTDNGAWCKNENGPTAVRVGGGVGAAYVDIQADLVARCAAWPFNIPSFGWTLMMRFRFMADNPNGVYHKKLEWQY